jgi:hypothetical protein
VTDIDCTQYLATSADTGELLTRDGRVLVSTKTEWKGIGRLVGTLIPCPKRPFGAVDLVSRGREEVDVEEIAAIIKTKREDHEPGGRKDDTDYRMAEAIHARLYGPKMEDRPERASKSGKPDYRGMSINDGPDVGPFTTPTYP